MILYVLSWAVVSVAAIAVVIAVLWYVTNDFTDWTNVALLAAIVLVFLAVWYIQTYNSKKADPTTQVEKL